MSYSKIRLYVKSVKTVTGTDELVLKAQVEGHGVSPLATGPSYSYVTIKPKREWVLARASRPSNMLSMLANMTPRFIWR